MTTAELRQWPVYRQLEAYEESGTMDHANTREGWAPEDTMAVGIATALLLERVNRGWRERVFRGVEPYREEANRLHQDLLVVWLRVTEALLERLAGKDNLERVVQGSEELRAAAQRLRSLLDSWQLPQLSRAVGLRDMTFSQEAADEIASVLKRPAPPMPVSGVKLADPAQFPENELQSRISAWASSLTRLVLGIVLFGSIELEPRADSLSGYCSCRVLSFSE